MHIVGFKSIGYIKVTENLTGLSEKLKTSKQLKCSTEQHSVATQEVTNFIHFATCACIWSSLYHFEVTNVANDLISAMATYREEQDF